MMTIAVETFPRGFNPKRILGYEATKVPASTRMARWQSGDAEDCKSLYAGSIPARASNSLLFAANALIPMRFVSAVSPASLRFANPFFFCTNFAKLWLANLGRLTDPV